MISVDEAKSAIWDALSPLPAQSLPLEAAHKRILAAPVVARMDQPPFNSSAMDGFAVRLDDVRKEGARLSVIGISSAGERFTSRVGEGDAVRIFTGAPVPEGANHVVIQEDTIRQGDALFVRSAQERVQNVRPLGADFKLGETLLEAGELLTGPALALAAAGGAASVEVARRPRVALIANGDELVLPGVKPGPDEVICSIPFGLAPMIEDWGGEAAFLGIARDDRKSIRRLAERGLSFDILVPIGGASVGDRDFMRAVFAEIGFDSIFEKVSVKPGKPAWFGFARGTAVIGLPGNPASALVTAALFLRPAIARLLGRPRSAADAPLSARLNAPLGPNGPRESYLRARIVSAEDGAPIVTPFENQDSSLISVMARSNALIRRQKNTPAIKAGAIVDCILL